MDDGSARRSRRKEVVYYEDGRFFVSNRNLKTPRKTFRVARIEKLALRRDPFFICLPIIALLVAFAVRFDGYLYDHEKIIIYGVSAAGFFITKNLAILFVESKAVSEPAAIGSINTLRKVRHAVEDAIDDHHDEQDYSEDADL